MIKILLLILTLTYFTQAQTVSFSAVHHSGKYATGVMLPTYDYDITIYQPITEKVAISIGVYYYYAKYKEIDIWKENYWYTTISISYTISDKPIF